MSPCFVAKRFEGHMDKRWCYFLDRMLAYEFLSGVRYAEGISGEGGGVARMNMIVTYSRTT